MSEEIQKSLKRNEDGKLIHSIMNLVLCFEIDENLQDLFHYNEFSASFEYARDFQWPERTKIIPKGKRIEDEDIVFIRYYLAHNKQFQMPKEEIRDALMERADRKSYHPVKEYLNKLEWDGVKRLDEWLIKGCGVDDNIYSQEVGRKWITAAVSRIYSPGIKFDHVLVLEGKENIGKSSALRVLGNPWFTDSVSLIQKEADIVAKMIGNWFIELAEMQGLRKQESEFIKGFISCQIDEQRLSYRRDPKKYYRQSVFAGTSNNMAYLLDADGNRRFWPVLCNKIDITWLRENKDQLFAEAKNIYDAHIWSSEEPWGEKLFLEGEALEMSKGQQKMRLNTDEVLEEVIQRYLIGKETTTMSDILINCIGHKLTDSNTRSQQVVVGRILKRLGFERKERKASDGSTFTYSRIPIVSQDYKIFEEEE
jgi:putative DNA primase/helicase